MYNLFSEYLESTHPAEPVVLPTFQEIVTAVVEPTMADVRREVDARLEQMALDTQRQGQEAEAALKNLVAADRGFALTLLNVMEGGAGTSVEGASEAGQSAAEAA